MRRRFYRWGSWTCCFCAGVNPGLSCFYYQPRGGLHNGARGPETANFSDANVQPWTAPEDSGGSRSLGRRNPRKLRGQYRESLIDDERVNEAHAERMEVIAQRREGKEEKKRAAIRPLSKLLFALPVAMNGT